MVSSLAVADVNDDGDYEIFTGFSDYYYTLSPDHPTFGFRLLGLDSQANDLPGWEGGKPMGGVSMMSPAIGDIAGDAGPEIVTIGGDKKLYAWHANGAPVAGFPMTPIDTAGGTSYDYRSYSGIALADFDGDPKMEVFFNQAWAVTIVDGTGVQLTGTDFPNSSKPVYYGFGMMVNTPAVGDIDNDGRLELVATNSTARAWDLNNSNNKADWPMFRGDALHQARVSRNAFVAGSPNPLTIYRDIDDSGPIEGPLSIYPPQGGAISWNAATSGNLSLATTSGTALPAHPSHVLVNVHDSGFGNGIHSVGEIDLVATAIGEDTGPVYATVPVSVYLGDFYYTYLPLAGK